MQKTESMMDKIAILIPCYNEAKTIGKVIDDWKRSIPEAVIYVYDNNSKDETAAIAKNAGAVVRHDHEHGLGEPRLGGGVGKGSHAGEEELVGLPELVRVAGDHRGLADGLQRTAEGEHDMTAEFLQLF